MEYHVLITLFVIAALVLASEFSSVTAGEIGGLSTQAACGLVGQWNFDDGTGTDLSGNGNHAVLGGAKIYSLGEGHACIETVSKTEPLRIPVSENSPLAMSRGTTVSFTRCSTLASTSPHPHSNPLSFPAPTPKRRSSSRWQRLIAPSPN